MGSSSILGDGWERWQVGWGGWVRGLMERGGWGVVRRGVWRGLRGGRDREGEGRQETQRGSEAHAISNATAPHCSPLTPPSVDLSAPRR